MSHLDIRAPEKQFRCEMRHAAIARRCESQFARFGFCHGNQLCDGPDTQAWMHNAGQRNLIDDGDRLKIPLRIVLQLPEHRRVDTQRTNLAYYNRMVYPSGVARAAISMPMVPEAPE